MRDKTMVVIVSIMAVFVVGVLFLLALNLKKKHSFYQTKTTLVKDNLKEILSAEVASVARPGDELDLNLFLNLNQLNSNKFEIQFEYDESLLEVAVEKGEIGFDWDKIVGSRLISINPGNNRGYIFSGVIDNSQLSGNVEKQHILTIHLKTREFNDEESAQASLSLKLVRIGNEECSIEGDIDKRIAIIDNTNGSCDVNPANCLSELRFNVDNSGDGLNIIDALLVFRKVAHRPVPGWIESDITGDIDCNGRVELFDAGLIFKATAIKAGNTNIEDSTLGDYFDHSGGKTLRELGWLKHCQ